MPNQPEPTTLPKGLAAAHAARLARAEAGERIEHRNPLEKLALNPLSLRAAINAMCYQCEGEDADPGVRRRIGTCPIKTCALWAVRPYQRMADSD
jgi:hypothetical protein